MGGNGGDARGGLGRRWEVISNWTSKEEKPKGIVAKSSFDFKEVNFATTKK